ncbi:MAG: DUF2231 domain-containing protein [Pseudolabrys sp.]|nr:DUF2231 domain-containing protein [Pseudolabrys sp.]
MPNPKSTAQIAGHPVHPMLIPFPIAAFVATLLTDLALRSSGNDFWYEMSLYLLGGGLIFAALAAVAGLIDVMGDQQIRNINDAWLHAGVNVVAVVLELINFFLRYGGGAASASGTGLWISLVVVLLLLFSGWKGWEMVYKHHVGVSDVRE